MYMNYFIHSMYLLIDALIMSCRGCNDDDRSAILLNRKIVCSFHNIELLKKTRNNGIYIRRPNMEAKNTLLKTCHWYKNIFIILYMK